MAQGPQPILIGLNVEEIPTIKALAASVQVRLVTTQADVEALSNEDLNPANQTILCGRHAEGYPPEELAQFLRSCFFDSRLCFVSTSRDGLDIAKLKKNGFNEIFILPLDQKVLEAEVEKLKQFASSSTVRRYQAVKVLDLEPDSELKFELAVFLPMNKKHVTFVQKGAKVTTEKVEKLRARSIGSAYVPEDQIKSFYAYCSDRLVNLGNNGGLSETERSHRMQSAVRDLFQSIVESSGNDGFDGGKNLLNQGVQIVDQYVKAKTSVSISDQLQALAGDEQGAYEHATAVSTLACLFSLGTGIGKPEDMALAGLFHDLGLVDLSTQIDHEDAKQLSGSDLEAFMKHPQSSLRILKEKRITVDQTIAKIIEQHHERWDGKGFPKGISGNKFSPEAQLLSLADQLEHLISIRAGKKRVSIVEGLEIIQKNGSLPSELISQVRRIIPS